MDQYHVIKDYKQSTKMLLNAFTILFYCYFFQDFPIHLQYLGLALFGKPLSLYSFLSSISNLVSNIKWKPNHPRFRHCQKRWQFADLIQTVHGIIVLWKQLCLSIYYRTEQVNLKLSNMIPVLSSVNHSSSASSVSLQSQ